MERTHSRFLVMNLFLLSRRMREKGKSLNVKAIKT
jgi:hypothetical protein